MKSLLHYALLLFVAFFGAIYGLATSHISVMRDWIDHENYGPINPTGTVAFFLNPTFSYAILVMCVALVVKELYVQDMKKKVFLNLAGLLVVIFFYGVYSAAVASIGVQ